MTRRSISPVSVRRAMMIAEIDRLIDLAKKDMESDNLENAYETLEWASIYSPGHPTPYLMKSAILAVLHWRERKKYEELTGRSYGEFEEG